jgi:hypothetical protein
LGPQNGSHEPRVHHLDPTNRGAGQLRCHPAIQLDLNEFRHRSPESSEDVSNDIIGMFETHRHAHGGPTDPKSLPTVLIEMVVCG